MKGLTKEVKWSWDNRNYTAVVELISLDPPTLKLHREDPLQTTDTWVFNVKTGDWKSTPMDWSPNGRFRKIIDSTLKEFITTIEEIETLLLGDGK